MNTRLYPTGSTKPISTPIIYTQLLWCFLLAIIGCGDAAAESPVGVYSGEQTSTFNDYCLSASADKQYLHMESLWEMDLSEVADGAAAADADQNNHNLFAVEDKICIYVEQYQPHEICLRYADANTGSLNSISIAMPDNFKGNEIHKMVFHDDANHIVLVGYTENGAPNKPLKITVNIYDLNLNLLGSRTYQGQDDQKGDHLLQYFEWLGLTGDVLSGEFKLTIGGWHNYKAESTTRDSYPSVCTFTFTNDNDEPTIDVVRYASGSHYTFETRKYDSLSAKKLEGLLFSTSISQDKHLIQSFGTKSSCFAHSPVLLYDNTGKSDSRSSVSAYPLFEQSDILDNQALVADPESDTPCFGVFPVKIADEQLLILPYKFNPEDGVKFKIAQWIDLSSLDNVSELWQFPNKKKFPYPTQIYDYARPKVVVIPGIATSEKAQDTTTTSSSAATTVYVLMPGSLLGAYKISMIDDNIASNIADPFEPDWSTTNYTLTGRTLTLSGCMAATNIKLYTISGLKVIDKTVPDSKSISLDNLSSGPYILKINNEAHKIILK